MWQIIGLYRSVDKYSIYTLLRRMDPANLQAKLVRSTNHPFP
jgi:hypothetical protein